VRFAIPGEIAAWKYPKDVAWRRFGNILVPLCKLAGLDFTVGGKVEGPEFPYFYGDVDRLYTKLGHIAKFSSKLEPSEREPYVTITLRDSFRNTYRNSNREAWFKFADWINAQGLDAEILDECETAPLDPEVRMALYAGARMNLGSSNGPMALCHFSDAPYLTFNMSPPQPAGEGDYDNDQMLRRQGLSPGTQLSFHHDRQWLLWEPDDFETICHYYRRYE
jgi:hypothetical protein